MGELSYTGHREGLSLLSGLLPNEVAGVTRALDMERWLRAEERTAELIACIQPNQPSEERRNAVAYYVQRLIMKCFSCQVFTFGSVPLKTYLPDGDIDLTTFSKNPNLKDTWAQKVRDVLLKEEKNENAEFRVKEVQYIQAEVKIIKCLVEDIVVDISFNQLGGLCTLCFLEEVDHLINHNHLFKRSIILIKAWCYYESRILGAHHGLISTYALETLVLYIFHVFNNSFAGPLEVLYRFLEFFSNFDWDNFCVSLWGPVPISSFPDMTAEPPRRDSGELLLSNLFLDACSSVYAVFPGGQENQGQPFASKHFNVIDPLRTNNNLGRSVNKGNFFRIRSAFAFGAKRLARLLECPKENIIAEVNQFFMNTWERHGSGHRPDAPSPDIWPSRPFNPDPFNGSENVRKHSSMKKKGEHVGSPAGHESLGAGAIPFHGIPSQPIKHVNHNFDNISRTSNVPVVSRTQSHRSYTHQTNLRMSDRIASHISSIEVPHVPKDQEISQPLLSEYEGQAKHLFARTRSSPELAETATDAIPRARNTRALETGKNQFVATKPENGSRSKASGGSEVSASHSTRSSVDDPSTLSHSPSHQSLDASVATDCNSVSNGYYDESGFGGVLGEELASVSKTIEMHQEEQDLVNMMASSRVPNFNGQVQFPYNMASAHLPFPISPAVLASMGYAQRNLAGMVPASIPLIEPPWGSNMHLSQGLVSSPVSHYFPNVGLRSNPAGLVESANENSSLTDTNQEDADGFWHDEDADSTRGFDPDNGSFQMLQSEDKQRSNSGGFISSRFSNSGSSSTRVRQKFIKENKLPRDDHNDAFRYQYSTSDVYSTDQHVNSRFSPVAQASSSRSNTASECSWDGSFTKGSKSSRDKRGRKAAPPPVAATAYEKPQSGWHYEVALSDHASSQADDDNRDWIPLSTVGTEMAERSTGPTFAALPHVQSHQLSGYEPAQISGSDSMMPIAPMLVGSGPRQRAADNSGVLPFAFYPTGPPVPFLTMLPVYNFPPETASDGSASHLDRDDGLDNSCVHRSDQNFDSAESLDQSPSFTNSSPIKSVSADPAEEQNTSDILNSDFASHWQNLQYGRFCQNSRYHGPLIYPSPLVVPPVYVQGHFPWDGPGRPLSANVNLFTQHTSYGPRFVPTPLQPGSNRPAGVYQRNGDEVPRYRGGTGTYLPNPKVPFRDRQSSTTRNNRWNHNSNRNDLTDREGNWNIGPKSRAAGRSHWRNQAEKPSSRPDRLTAADSHSDRQWDSYRHEHFNSYQTQNGPQNSANSMHGSLNMAYGMYPVNSSGAAPNGPAVPSVVMLCSYDHNSGYGSPVEQLEFGSLGPVHFSGISEGPSQVNDGGPVRGVHAQRHSTYQEGSPVRSSPDQSSSPQRQRGI